MSSAVPVDFRNESTLKFSDISSEEWREYHFESGTVVRIVSPLRLNVSASGGHRIFDAQGESHYVPAGWIHLKWQAKSDAPHFVR